MSKHNKLIRTMFQNPTTQTKLALLEERLSVYEKMIRKIDSAIEKISETSQSISKMLIIHEERIEQTAKSDNIIIKIVDDVKLTNTMEHKAVMTRMDSIEKNVNELLKFRWQVAAISGAAILLVGLVLPLLDNVIEMPYNERTEQPTKK